ncbi:MAG: leucine-rich repeat domain-containing protein [Ruminococcus sp.]|nr:leucine-rich repeat domain-containing protein [Ruminococcus sp.]
MTKKNISAAAAVICAAAGISLCFAGCSSAGKDSTDSSQTTEEPSTTTAPIIDPEGNTLAVKPTERPREIEETADFEFEERDGGAVITKYTGSAEDVVIPGTLGGAPVTEIGYYSFEAKWDMHSVTVPDSVTTIGEFCFSDCSSLSSINIPEGVTVIERGAFAACTSIEELTIPAAVTEIHEEAFTACESLVSLTIENPGLQYDSWGLEELPDVVVYAPAGSAVLQWAEQNGVSCAELQ